jgi:hypothetical protein
MTVLGGGGAFSAVMLRGGGSRRERQTNECNDKETGKQDR